MNIFDITLPGSKSIAARAIILDRVYGTQVMFENLPVCDDTCELQAAFSDFDSGAHEFNLGTGATSLRFFLAYVASLPDFECQIDCSDSLRRRPLEPLVEALRSAGADIEYLGEKGRTPLRVRGAKLDGSAVSVDCSLSSQFASALLLVSHLWKKPYILPKDMPTVSQPYIDMTLRMISQFENLSLQPGARYKIEADWSAAAFFIEYVMLHPEVRLYFSNLSSVHESLQGDARCVELFSARGGTFDMSRTPDLVPALAVGWCRAGFPFKFTGVSHLRHKECDRLQALAEELAKAGFRLKVDEDSISWEGDCCEQDPDAVFDSHGDHRIIMALWAAGYRNIRGCENVSKSFPAFFDEMNKLN